MAAERAAGMARHGRQPSAGLPQARLGVGGAADVLAGAGPEPDAHRASSATAWGPRAGTWSGSPVWSDGVRLPGRRPARHLDAAGILLDMAQRAAGSVRGDAS